MSKLRDLPIEGYLLDLSLLGLVVWRTVYSASQPELTADFYRYLYWSVGVLQCLALYSVFSGDLDIADDENRSIVARVLSPISGLIMILSLGAFIWIIIPADAIGAQGSVVVNFIIVLFGSWVALGIALEKRFDSSLLLHRGLTALFVLAYLSASESLLIYAVQNSSVGVPAAMFGALISYLPVRMMLILRAPVNDSEAALAMGSFGCFLYALLQA